MPTYPSTNPRKRASSIKVSLTPQLHAELIEIAEAYGQTPATSASFAIGQWVAQHKRTLAAGEAVAAQLVAHAAPHLVESINHVAGGKA